MAQRVQVILVCDLHDGEVEGTETRRAGRATGGGSRRSRGGRSGGGDNKVAQIREWARSNGHQVSERGRISATVKAAYDAAH